MVQNNKGLWSKRFKNMQKLVKITNHPKYSALDHNRDILKINHYFIMKKN